MWVAVTLAACYKSHRMGGPFNFQGVITVISRRGFVISSIGLVSAPSAALAAKPQIYTSFLSSSAVGGYDPVAYFTKGKPVKGLSKYTLKWKGANWYFSSQENLDKFKADMEAYAPQFGGYCAYGVSQNAAVKGDPLLWKIVDGKLYLNINKQVVNIWNKDIPGYIAKANANWPNVLK